ncbi:MAG TPA: hydantoinase/oxoprolinase family protein, partial [Anaerolineae bacterium]|nr:hydantoinase/oxoprolinase family protein [Anaerolineae bacterium]
PEHETRIGQMARERGLFVSLSSRILPEYREFERASTTVINAYVSPIMARYLANLEVGLMERGHRTLWIMQSSGGIISAGTARQEAVRTVLSGPAAGVTGAFHVAQLASYDHIITFDMGGTSTDVSLADGAIRRTTEGSIESWPVRVPMIDIHTVGAGGGSIAWADAGGALRIGPQSAGSEPGPACYGRGGRDFTVTDANLLLGRVSAENFLGGRMKLDQDAAWSAAQRLGQPLGLEPLETAEGVIRVANARMEQAIRVISIERGFDPREFTLVPFGGAGPMHALEMAAALHIPRVLIPRYPGVLSALGLTLADLVKDYSRTVMWAMEGVRTEDLAQGFAPLLAQARADLQAEGFSEDAIRLEQALDLRYKGQSFELTVPLMAYDPVAAVQGFYDAHRRRYGYAREGEPVELVNLRVTARGLRPTPPMPQYRAASSPDPASARVGQTQLRFQGQTYDAAIYQRAQLQPGHHLTGPALIVQEDATTVAPPGWVGRIDPWLNLIFERR